MVAMNKKEIITITGTLGSGKSSTADGLAKELGYRRFSSGDFMRQIALKHGMSLNELQAIAEKDSSIDLEIDEAVRNAGTEEKIVIDSRLAFHWIPESFKVYLDLPPEIAKERVMHSLKDNLLRQQSEHATNADEAYQKITERLESEKKRYWELYKVDRTDRKNFDLIVDTDKNNLEQVITIVLEEYKKWLAK